MAFFVCEWTRCDSGDMTFFGIQNFKPWNFLTLLVHPHKIFWNSMEFFGFDWTCWTGCPHVIFELYVGRRNEKKNKLDRKCFENLWYFFLKKSMDFFVTITWKIHNIFWKTFFYQISVISQGIFVRITW